MRGGERVPSIRVGAEWHSAQNLVMYFPIYRATFFSFVPQNNLEEGLLKGTLFSLPR